MVKDYLVRAALPKTNGNRRCEPYGKTTCLDCHSEKVLPFEM